MELLPKGAFPALRSATEYFLSFTLHQIGQQETAISRLHQGILSSDSQEGYLMSRLLFGLCYIHMLDGEYLLVLQEGLRMKKLSITYRSAFAETWPLYALGNAAFQMFDRDAARHHFSLVLENRYMANPRAAVDAMAGLALTSQFMGKPDEADETLRLAQEYADWTKASEKIDIVASSRARLALLRGDIDSAARWQRAFRETPGIPIMLFFLELPAVTQCRVLIAIGSDTSLKGAMKRLKDLYTEAKTWRSTCWMMEILVLQALASYRLGQLEAALETLAQAVAMAMPGSSIRPFVEPGRTMADLLNKLAEKGVAVDDVTTLLATLRDVETETMPDVSASNPVSVPSPSPQPLIEPLTHRELDVLELLAQRLQNKEIAEKLFISDETVKGHLKNIYRKLNVSKRRQAVEKAKALGILSFQ
jgi:LuxR family maltose regulon positive regulatory protein